jgi:intein-encoded DNA endonuclease-like protein
MRFAEHLRQTATESGGRVASRSERRRQRYLQERAEDLSNAACATDPENEVAKLGKKYAREFEKGGEHAEDAGILSKACLALANGEDPAHLSSSM